MYIHMDIWTVKAQWHWKVLIKICRAELWAREWTQNSHFFTFSVMGATYYAIWSCGKVCIWNCDIDAIITNVDYILRLILVVYDHNLVTLQVTRCWSVGAFNWAYCILPTIARVAREKSQVKCTPCENSYAMQFYDPVEVIQYPVLRHYGMCIAVPN